MFVRSLIVASFALWIVAKAAEACPPAPVPAAAPAVTIAAPAAQAFAQAGAATAAQVVPGLVPAVPQVLVPQMLPTFAVVPSVAVVPASVQSVALVRSSTRCRSGLLSDLRLARQTSRAARRAVLSSRRCGSTAVSQAIAVERN
jgi:hypothetical protein